MPLSTALRRCPQAVFLPADHAAYDESSAEVWDVVRSVVDQVEVWGWDEGFLGADVDDPELLAHALRRVVVDRTSFTCCIGIGDNKIRAKLAAFANPVASLRMNDRYVGSCHCSSRCDVSPGTMTRSTGPAPSTW